MSGRRPERLAEQIREEVSLIIAGDMRDPRAEPVTVTDARITPDLRYAKVYVSVQGTAEEAAKSVAALNRASGFIRHQLSQALRMKRVPELRFVFDEAERTAVRIEQLLNEEGNKATEEE
jgi:ribosome-binding factor A